jgi:hypothetical protein
VARIDRLERELEAVLSRIVDADTERVILFGSAVRGDVGSTSEFDLLVIRRDARRPAGRALDKIAGRYPELGAHLSATVRRGYACAYVPDPRIRVSTGRSDGPSGLAAAPGGRPSVNGMSHS